MRYSELISLPSSFLSKASKLDDETECDTIFDPNKYFDLIEGALEKEVINIIVSSYRVPISYSYG